MTLVNFYLQITHNIQVVVSNIKCMNCKIFMQNMEIFLNHIQSKIPLGTNSQKKQYRKEGNC